MKLSTFTGLSRDGTVKLAFEAPPEVDIVRTELLDRHLSED